MLTIRGVILAVALTLAVPAVGLAQADERASGPESWVAFQAEVERADALFADIRADMPKANTRETVGLLWSELYVAMIDHALAMDDDFLWHPCYAQYASARYSRILYEAVVVADVLRKTATHTETELSRADSLVQHYFDMRARENTTRGAVSCVVT